MSTDEIKLLMYNKNKNPKIGWKKLARTNVLLGL